MPGDTLTDTVDVANKSINTVKLYMRATGATGDDASFLSQMNIKVDQREGNNLFDAAADQKGGLADWVLIGDMAPGAKATLDISLSVPITMDNEYQDAVGQIGWQFKAEEDIPYDPTEPTDPGDHDTPGDGSGDGGGSKTTTGDRVMIGAALLLLLAAAFGTSYVIRRRKADAKQ